MLHRLTFVSAPKLSNIRHIHRRTLALSKNSPLQSFAPLLPHDVLNAIESLHSPDDVFEVTMDLGRPPTIRKLLAGEVDVPVIARVITRTDLDKTLKYTGSMDSRNRTGIDGTLHRISAILNSKNEVVGLTCRVGRETPDIASQLHPILKTNHSFLIIGKPGSGKTSLLRDVAKTLADTYKKRVMIVDKSGEIAGYGDIPHGAIGSARRLLVPRGVSQHEVMIEAVENHTPDIVLIDEISTFQETKACQTIAERGVRLIATAHGLNYENIIKNPALNHLVGGISTVTLGDVAAKTRGSQKTVAERTGAATFTRLVEISNEGQRVSYTIHDTEAIVDSYVSKRHVK